MVLDDVGHGQIFGGSGFQPKAPLEITFVKSDGTAHSDFPDLEADVRGVFEQHLFAARKDIGDATFTVTDGSCIAQTDFTTPADRFPEVDCTPEEPATDVDLTASEDYEAMVSADEPLSYWRFEEESGDQTENTDGVAAVPMNEVVLGQPGFIEGSRSVLLVEWTQEVQGSDVGGWLDIPEIELDEDFTIEAWYRFCGEFIWFQDVLVGQDGDGPNINFFDWHAHLFSGDFGCPDLIAGRERGRMAPSRGHPRWSGPHHVRRRRADSHRHVFRSIAR